MRAKTKELLQSKLRNPTPKGHMAEDQEGDWVHVRDVQSIIDCECKELQELADVRLRKMKAAEKRRVWVTLMHEEIFPKAFGKTGYIASYVVNVQIMAVVVYEDRILAFPTDTLKRVSYEDLT